MPRKTISTNEHVRFSCSKAPAFAFSFLRIVSFNIREKGLDQHTRFNEIQGRVFPTTSTEFLCPIFNRDITNSSWADCKLFSRQVIKDRWTIKSNRSFASFSTATVYLVDFISPLFPLVREFRGTERVKRYKKYVITKLLVLPPFITVMHYRPSDNAFWPICPGVAKKSRCSIILAL